MKYRTLAGEKVSVLGFGCMRFPLTGEKRPGDIDIEKAEEMLMHAYNSGVNYFDTAYPYHDGESEKMLGNFLEKNNLRDKIKIATKSPVWMFKSEEDFDRTLDEQLKRLKTDYVDFYLLHALDKNEMENYVEKFGIIEKLSRAKRDGRVRHIGFSFHDDIDTFKRIVDINPEWEFCQIQLNYVNTNYQAGLAGLEYAHEKGLDVIIMEPLLGGRLANLSDIIKKEMPQNRSEVEWALDYLWNRKEVSVILSGMGAMEQVKSNIEYANRSEIGMLFDKDLDMLAHIKELFESMSMVPCTRCAYCMPCPFGLDIPKTFEAYNLTGASEKAKAKEIYDKISVKADKCHKCGVCERKCPQGIKVITEMEKIAELFAKK